MTVSEEIQCHKSISPNFLSKCNPLLIANASVLLLLAVVSFFFLNPLLKTILISTALFLDESNKLYSSFLFIIFHIIASLFGLPLIYLNFVGGFLYGFYWGFIFNVISCFTSSLIPFFVSKHKLKPLLDNYLPINTSANLFLQILRPNELLLLILLRLCPLLPFSLLNYLMGLYCSSQKYVIATFYGMIPSVLFYSYFGSLITFKYNVYTLPDFKNDLFCVSGSLLTVVTTIVPIVIITTVIRRALNKIVFERLVVEKSEGVIVIEIK